MSALRGENAAIGGPRRRSRESRDAPREQASEPSEILNLLKIRSAQFDAALTNMPHGLCMFDASGCLILCNPAYMKLYNLPPKLTVAGTPLTRILEYRKSINNAPSNLETYFDVVHAALQSGRFASKRIVLQDGRTIHLTHNPMPDGGYVATHEDVSGQVAAEAKIRYLATHDHLTGLSNRRFFMEKLETLLARAERMKWHAVHCLDLDQFKPVNDRFGHPMGDLLLKLVKDRFLACTREEDTVARLGGDEFGVLQQGLSRPEDAGKLASRLIEQIGVPYDLGGNEVKIGVSIGIALWPDNGLSVEELLHCADVALYRAKLEGRNGFRYS